MIERIVIENLRPTTPSGRYPAKAVIGEEITLSADVFREGHDLLAVRARWRAVGERLWAKAPMTLWGDDRWGADIALSVLGMHEFGIEAWTDSFGTWKRDVAVKRSAGQDIDVDLEEGARLIKAGIGRVTGKQAALLEQAARLMRDPVVDADERLAAALRPGVAAIMEQLPPGEDWTESCSMKIWADRPRALTGAWYELFPRSEGGLAGTAKRLPAVARMGFDVVYLPPIHPIGTTHRKGANNTLVAGPDDPGSPWSIGSPDGGHTAIHRELGTFEDFRLLVESAEELGMEIALDYALQCSPDHPWVTEHPEWFKHRPDGTIRYAENPPKKYQDIYPIEFWPEKGRQELWDACREIVEFWINKGVKIFRVDNPHTKPLAFWEWMIPLLQSRHPETIFLAEAFTNRKMMAKLAEIGFTQSYTYFTWRQTKQELTDYLMELAHGPLADYMRPNFWPNTPDILSGPLRRGGPAAFKQRLVLAATMSPSYGLYNGYELYENQPSSEADEEYLNSEKFEVKNRAWDVPGSLVGYITKLNQIRRAHPALWQLRNIAFHETDNDKVIVFSKATKDRSDVVIAIVSLDSGPQQARVNFNMPALGLIETDSFSVLDELNGGEPRRFAASTVVRLDPDLNPAELLHVQPVPSAERADA